ncbi:cytochrome P450 [Actinosynnema sp. NPDC047251]|uniref:Cytochrome P450, 107B1 family n=1 Tax=Saccharothrix espanaensis (strain ATCC 51144 / DSM 44229 / JCM 9112 / NBRC 15066 / NRRL 15764) TaxID=1179773 RepID=K0KC00_SACES|nr:cytochrome P450 [Saccharothrix espanaensis]CCH34118.1 Cytochrome P450, 107B1 family [Saccharothrix espanaensis DSM 44229]
MGENANHATALAELGDAYFQDPHAFHAELREESAARPILLPRGLKVWLVTRYDEARLALADPRLSKDFAGFLPLFERHQTGTREATRFDNSLVQHMLNSDPPTHTRLRKLVMKAFTPRRVEQLRPRIQQITDDLLDAVADRGETDLVEALAFPLPITVICEMLGIPLDDRDDFREWSNTLVAGNDPDAVEAAGTAMAGFLSTLVDTLRAHPGDDIFSALIHATDENDRLDQTELISMAFLLLVAGHETTVNLIATGVLNLLRHPEQLDKLRADRTLLPGAVEEFLRYEGPVNQATFRFTTEEVTLGDVTIPEGEFVLASLMSANRDERRFADGESFDITRAAGGHLAFGHGIHYCLGAPLARLEGEIAVGTLLDRYDIALTAEPETLRWRSSTLMRGLYTLPVSLSARGAR